MNPKALSRRDFLQAAGALAASTILPFSPTYLMQPDRKRIYIALDDHTDYMWTADEATYRQVFLESLDYYLDLADTTEHEPPEYQSRWNCDGSFWLWTYEKNKTTAEFERLIDHLRSGHISVPLNALVVCLGGAPAEAVIRGMYYPGKIERRYDLRFPLVYAMENQTLPYGLVSLWAGSGAKYSWKGICNCATKVASAGDREHDIYWWEGRDGSRILMKWNSFYGNQSIGGYAEARDPAAAIDLVDTNADFQARYPYKVIGAFGKGWDNLETMTDEFVTVAKASSNAQRLVIVSNEQDFFEDFEAVYGDQIPAVSRSYGNEWDLYCASMAEVSASVKRSVEKLRSAEAMATLVALKSPDSLALDREARDQAWMNLGLYWEHDWTADGQVPRQERADWQRRIAAEIASYVDGLSTSAADALGSLIEKPSDLPSFYVFNPLSWERTDVADLAYTGPWPVHVVDLVTGEEVPSQQLHTDTQDYLRILARDVSAVGYRAYEIRAGQGQEFGPAATSSDDRTIENDHYRLTLGENGSITNLLDLTRDSRDYVREIDGRAVNDLGSGAGIVEVENAGPVSVTLRATTQDAPARTCRVTLFRDLDRIDIDNRITQNFSDVLTWGFGFDLENPDTRHEEVGAVLRARLTTDGGDYSPRNARYDWLTLNHFVDMSDGKTGITLSNADCYFVRLGQSTPGQLDTSTPQISVLAGGQVDGPNLGIQNQGGDSSFLQRFALRTHDDYDATQAMRFALAHQNPLVAGSITGGNAYPAPTYSLLTISEPGVLLWALKPAEDGIDTGVIVRLWNLDNKATSPAVHFLHSGVETVTETTHIETPIQAVATDQGEFDTTLQAQQMKTFAIKLA